MLNKRPCTCFLSTGTLDREGIEYKNTIYIYYSLHIRTRPRPVKNWKSRNLLLFTHKDAECHTCIVHMFSFSKRPIIDRYILYIHPKVVATTVVLILYTSRMMLLSLLVHCICTCTTLTIQKKSFCAVLVLVV